jgi:hypothetical protein
LRIVTLGLATGGLWSLAVSHASRLWERASFAEPSPEGEATRCSRAACPSARVSLVNVLRPGCDSPVLT